MMSVGWVDKAEGKNTPEKRQISVPTSRSVRTACSPTQVTNQRPSRVMATGPPVYNGAIVRAFLKLKETFDCMGDHGGRYHDSRCFTAQVQVHGPDVFPIYLLEDRVKRIEPRDKWYYIIFSYVGVLTLETAWSETEVHP
jgi:hypothetical protein